MSRSKQENPLKTFITEIVRASPEYMKKEKTREALQQVVVGMIVRGEIKSDIDLDNFFSSADMSLKALKMVPFDVYAKLSGKKKSDPNTGK